MLNEFVSRVERYSKNEIPNRILKTDLCFVPVLGLCGGNGEIGSQHKLAKSTILTPKVKFFSKIEKSVYPNPLMACHSRHSRSGHPGSKPMCSGFSTRLGSIPNGAGSKEAECINIRFSFALFRHLR